MEKWTIPRQGRNSSVPPKILLNSNCLIDPYVDVEWMKKSLFFFSSMELVIILVKNFKMSSLERLMDISFECKTSKLSALKRRRRSLLFHRFANNIFIVSYLPNLKNNVFLTRYYRYNGVLYSINTIILLKSSCL